LSGRLGVSRIIAGLSLWNRALKQGGDEVRTFSTRLKALGSTESFRTVTKSMTHYLKQYDMSLRKNGREHVYTLKENMPKFSIKKTGQTHNSK